MGNWDIDEDRYRRSEIGTSKNYKGTKGGGGGVARKVNNAIPRKGRGGSK